MRQNNILQRLQDGGSGTGAVGRVDAKARPARLSGTAETQWAHSVAPRRERLMQLYDGAGRRKYLTPGERRAFIAAAQDAPPEVRTFCATLAHSGCRISEALALTADRIDIAGGVLVFESLKKRRKGVYRAVPVPPGFLKQLADVHDLRRCGNRRLWSWSRTTAWRRVGEVMEAANVRGLCASPKGVRHGFGIKAVTSDVPLNMTQKWLGHAKLSTTLIYTNVTGPEERRLAERMWE